MKMKMTAADYEGLGAVNAEKEKINGEPFASHDYDRASTSWQSRAYWKGYDSWQRHEKERDRQKASRIIGVSPERMSSNTNRWPQAAAEHAVRLVVDLTAERNVRRRQRLAKAIQRMQKRYEYINRNQGTLA